MLQWTIVRDVPLNSSGHNRFLDPDKRCCKGQLSSIIMEGELGPRGRKRRSSNNRKVGSVWRDAGLGEEKKGFAGQMKRSTSQVNAQCWHRSRGAVPMMRKERGSERGSNTTLIPGGGSCRWRSIESRRKKKASHASHPHHHCVPTHLPQKTWQTHATVRGLLSPMPCRPSVSETNPPLPSPAAPQRPHFCGPG